MKLSRRDLLLYAVTDRMWLGGARLVDQVKGAVEAGVTMVQLREKYASEQEFLQIAQELLPVCRQCRVPLIINDNIDILLNTDADGLHIGQDDIRVREARERIGGEKILGVSAQTVEQALEAERGGADYLGVGAIFNTSTKLDAHGVSMQTLQGICRAVSIPVVAIGGIDKTNIASLAKSGVAGVAVVSAIFAQPDIKIATQELYAICKDTFLEGVE